MPRRLRILPAGSLVHALNRGNDKRVLFDCSEEFEDFLELVRWAKGKCLIRILAYCLMRNHWHFILWPRTDDDVATFFHELTTAHALHRRRITDTVGGGHVYQDRYKAFPILSESYYFAAMRYVEGNALRANMVTRAADWPWSSLRERSGEWRGILDNGPVDLPEDWALTVDGMVPGPLLEDIRKQSCKF